MNRLLQVPTNPVNHLQLILVLRQIQSSSLRLRMRHFPFRIGQPERDAWLAHMRAAVEASPASPADAAALTAYFESAATSLINHPG